MSATVVGNLEIVLGANMAGFVKGIGGAVKSMQDAEAKGNKFGSTLIGVAGKIGAAFINLKTMILGAAAAFGAYKLVGSLNEAAEAVDTLGKSSKRLGIGIEQLSVLKFAAGEAGVDFESLAGAVGKFNKNIGQALGKGSSTLSVGNFALALRDVNGNVRSLPDLLADAASALEHVGNEAERADLAEGLFGRDGGTKFLTLLGEGTNFISNMADQWERASRLNLIFSQDDVDKLTAYNDAIGRIGLAFDGLKVKLMVVVAPALTAIADRFALLVAAVPNIYQALVGQGLKEDDAAKLKASLSAFGSTVFGMFKVIGGSAAEIMISALYDTLRNAKVMLDPIVRWLGREVMLTWTTAVADAMDAVGLKDSAMALLEGARVLKITDDIISAQKLLIGLRSAEGFQYGATSMAISDAVSGISQQAGEVGIAADQLVNLAAAFKKTGDTAAAAAGGVHGFGASVASLKPTFITGVADKLGELRKQAADLAALGGSMIDTFATGFSTELADALTDAETNFSNFGEKVSNVMEGLGRTIVKMAIQFMLLRAVTSSLSYAFDSMGMNAGSSTPDTSKSFYTDKLNGVGTLANGGAVVNGRIERFAGGGVVTRPTLFPMASGTGLMGEAGPEGVLPLKRVGGKLGVNAAGLGTVVNIIDQRSGAPAPRVSENQGPDGRKVISVLIRDEIRKGMADGSFDRSMAANFGLGRRAATR